MVYNTFRIPTILVEEWKKWILGETDEDPSMIKTSKRSRTEVTINSRTGKCRKVDRTPQEILEEIILDALNKIPSTPTNQCPNDQPDPAVSGEEEKEQEEKTKNAEED